jgi:hypothetical protein
MSHIKIINATLSEGTLELFRQCGIICFDMGLWNCSDSVALFVFSIELWNCSGSLTSFAFQPNRKTNNATLSEQFQGSIAK